MTEAEMWRAVVENDASCDGRFFYAVQSTGIYCRPSCKSKPPRRENIRFFETARQAESAGFCPCKRCRSDLADYQPVREIAKKAKKLLEDSFYEGCALNRELRQLGVSRRRMAEIFREEYGLTLSEYAGNLRGLEAKRLGVGHGRRHRRRRVLRRVRRAVVVLPVFQKRHGPVPRRVQKGASAMIRFAYYDFPFGILNLGIPTRRSFP